MIGFYENVEADEPAEEQKPKASAVSAVGD
jgi:hypothetical protein